MDSVRFDALARSTATSRRGSLRALAGLLLALTSHRLPAAAASAPVAAGRPARRRPNFNGYGCLNVGQKCRGNDNLCCSGRCSGRKPKRGEQDKSRCLAHHTGGCTPQRSLCLSIDAALCGASSSSDYCFATTGNAGFCADVGVFGQANCRACRKDKDCEILGFGPGAACVLFGGAPSCAGCTGSGFTTACVSPAV